MKSTLSFWNWVLIKVFKFRYYAIHSVNPHGHRLTWYVLSSSKSNFGTEGPYEVHDWTDYI